MQGHKGYYLTIISEGKEYELNHGFPKKPTKEEVLNRINYKYDRLLKQWNLNKIDKVKLYEHYITTYNIEKTFIKEYKL